MQYLGIPWPSLRYRSEFIELRSLSVRTEFSAACRSLRNSKGPLRGPNTNYQGSASSEEKSIRRATCEEDFDRCNLENLGDMAGG